MPAGYDPLAQKRIARMWKALMDVRQMPENLRYIRRTPIVPATESEITARLTERAIIADLVGDDQKALVRNDHQVTLEALKVPNIKRGTHVSQEMLNLVSRITAGQTIAGDDNIFENYLRGRLNVLLLAVRQQMNLMAVGMMLDAYAWTGNGIITGTITFGTPSALKVTPGTAWSNTSATPITDIFSIRQTARETYGVDYNRIEMSTTAFNNAIATDEFRNKASGLRFFNFTADTLPSMNAGLMRATLGQLLDGMQVEIDDSQYGREDARGDHSYTRYLPVNKVLLSNTSDDNDQSVADFANGIPTESVVGSMNIQGAPRVFASQEYGPLAFATLPNTDLNPPNANLWGVARGFPRKHKQAAHAVLTVG